MPNGVCLLNYRAHTWPLVLAIQAQEWYMAPSARLDANARPSTCEIDSKKPANVLFCYLHLWPALAVPCKAVLLSALLLPMSSLWTLAPSLYICILLTCLCVYDLQFLGMHWPSHELCLHMQARLLTNQPGTCIYVPPPLLEGLFVWNCVLPQPGCLLKSL